MPYKNFTGGGPLTAESAKENFQYEEVTGRLFRKMRDGTYKETGTERSDGHRIIGYNHKNYRTTFVIWLLKYGRPPIGLVEHENTIASDDRLSNLREATQSQNMANISVTKRSKSGVKGVVLDKVRNKWAVYIGKDYKTYNIGRFDTLDEAIEARVKAHQEMFGIFSR